MSFIIKGIDIPKTCRQCPCCGDNGLVGMQRDYFCTALDCATSIDELDQKLTDCPLVEIPTPHGRLIDADALVNRIKNNYCNKCTAVEECGICVCQNCGVATLFDEIENSTTIIEAEVSE